MNNIHERNALEDELKDLLDKYEAYLIIEQEDMKPTIMLASYNKSWDSLNLGITIEGF